MTQYTTDTHAAGFVFDPNDPNFDVDPFPTYAFMREHLPVYWWEQAHGWVVTRYEDVAMVLSDPRFTTLPGGGPQPVPDELLTLHQRLTKYGLFWLPDSDHERVRRIATPLFMPKLVRSLRHKFEEVADAMLAARPHGPKFDVVQDFAAHYPLEGIIHLLGIPRERREDFRLFGSAVIDAFYPAIDPGALSEKMDYLPSGVAMLEELLDERAAHPEDDLLSKLVHAEDSGQRLTRNELISMVALMISAGCEPPRHLITFTIYNLLKHPEQLALLRDDPSLLAGAVNEVGRFDSFGKLNLPRFCLEDLEIRHVKISRGEAVFGVFASALRDPEVFADADRFDIRRSQARNMLYGRGPHNCLGKVIARLMVEVAVGTLLGTFPDMRPAGEPVFTRDAFFRKVVSLPLIVSSNVTER